MYEQNYGGDSPEILLWRKAYALVLRKVGKAKEAEALEAMSKGVQEKGEGQR